MALANKKILLGVTGGIAAYKAAELVRTLIKSSAQVRVMMTPAAMQFVTPLTFETLSGHPVLTDLFPACGGSGTVHIDWARWPDVVVLCPATANTIAKLAHGLADNALTTVLSATTAPVIFCPAMNKEMYASRIHQQNQKILQEHGYIMITPGEGELACGEVGWGRLAGLDEIADAIKLAVVTDKDLTGRKILITAGPTYEPLDPVRFLGNRSSGKMGYALAECAVLRGAQVTLISGPSQERAFTGVKLHRVSTAAQMLAAVQEHLADQDALIMAAAVSDYRPEAISDHKMKKKEETCHLQLQRTRDILTEAGSRKGRRIHVGFSVETENEVASSVQKMAAKNLDFIVLNNPLQPGAGFEVDTNIVTLIHRSGKQETWPKMSKREVAGCILDNVQALMANQQVQV